MIKVYPRFVGRLGNNMFQIAAAIGYAKQYGVEWGIRKGYVERGFNAFQVDKFFPNLPAASDGFQRHQEHPRNDKCELHMDHLDNCWFNYHRIPFYPEGVELAGFFQSWKYFEGAEQEVRDALRLPYLDSYKDYISIHVRRGDYVQYAHSFPPVTMDYINIAMSGFRSDVKYVVCSDDIQWCRENIIGNNIEYSTGQNEFGDMAIMASCQANIISNSTLAWWAAWLNPNPGKIIVAPSCKRGNWFGHGAGVKQDVVDLLPPSWHQIEFR